MAVRRKLALVVEILRVHRRARRAMLDGDVRTALRAVREPPTRVLDPVSAYEAARLARAVSRTMTALPVDERCLAQSLVLVGVLARRSTESTLVIGTRPTADGFGAHAWVELGGVALLPRLAAEYSRLVEL